VRRAALLNLPINPTTLPHLIDRTRDTDTTNRKLAYNGVLIPNVTEGNTDVVGPTHPRAMTIAQRELIIRNGLGDREPNVRKAAAELLVKWVDAVTPFKPKKEEDGEDVKPTKGKKEDGLLELLRMFDLTDSTVAADVVHSVFETQPSILNEVDFDGLYFAFSSSLL
jgi:condensin complex subunit 3